MNTLSVVLKTLGLCTVFLVLAIGCQQNLQTKSDLSPVDNSVLRVGITANAPPFVFKQAGAITGLEPSLALKLGKQLNKEVKFIEVPWDKHFDYLNDGKTDIIMSGMTITKQRSYLVNFSKPYLRSGQIMLVRMEDMQRFGSGMDSILNTNHRIGTVSDTVSDFFVSAAINGANEIAHKSPQDAVDALIKKEIDVFIYDAPIVCYYAAKHQKDKLAPILEMGTEEYIGWAVRKNDTKLLQEVNSFIETMDNQGLLNQEINYWIPYLYR